MSSSYRKRERRAEKESESWAREAARLKEEARLERLTLWERIEECGASDKVKDILHRLACGEREEY